MARRRAAWWPWTAGGVAALEQDVRRLDVAVHHAVAVRVAQRVGHLARDPQRVLERKLRLAVELRAERPALDERHDVVEEPAGLPRVVHGQDMGMGERRGQVDLAEEALGAERGSRIRPDDLDRHLAAVLQVASEVHGRHAARAELALNLAAAGQRRAQRFRRSVHPRCSRSSSRGPLLSPSLLLISGHSSRLSTPGNGPTCDEALRRPARPAGRRPPARFPLSQD